jgi:alpha-ketoglutarate-dependent taurine dioxygenase
MEDAQMNAPRILEEQCEWSAEDVADESLWTETLDEREKAELHDALKHALRVSDDLLDIEREHFPLPRFGDRLKRIEDELINGRGFVRIRGLDRDRYDQAEMEMIYWGIGTHFGTPWAQNKHGHVLGDVTDQRRALDDPNARGNELGSIGLPFHCDGSDLVGLMCLQNGVAGGLSQVANSVVIHNRLVREAPELAAELYEPQPYDFRGEQPPGERGWYTVPTFTECDGRLFVRCIPPYILASQRHADAPRLTPRAQQALQRLVELADDPANHLAMELRPGDMQFINNYHVMHGRTAYSDDREAGSIRHLKRLWLETRALKERPPHFQNSATHWDQKRSASRLRRDAS